MCVNLRTVAGLQINAYEWLSNTVRIHRPLDAEITSCESVSVHQEVVGSLESGVQISGSISLNLFPWRAYKEAMDSAVSN